MEKFIFLATVKDRLTEMNLPQESIDKHVKIFEDCFKGKNAEEVDGVIESAGGIDGIIKSIQNLESAKQKKSVNTTPESTSADDSNTNDTTIESEENTANVEEPVSDAETEQNDNEVPTMEIPKAPNIDKHIREAEEMTETMERIPVSQSTSDEEFSAELSEYDWL